MNPPPHPGLVYCEAYRCWLSPRACAARHRLASRPRRAWWSSPMEGVSHPATHATRCRNCAAGRERAREEEEMAKRERVRATDRSLQRWSELIGDHLAEKFLADARAAGRDPVSHLRHVVAEYYYLEQMGA